MRSLISGISIHKLEVFCMVVELGNVSRAAERLGIVQPAVSIHLKTLANKIGKPLLQQQGRKMRLTEVGERVHQWAQEVVSRTREIEREMDEGPGAAVVGASMTMGSYVLPELLAKFRARHIKGDICLRIASPQTIVDAVHSGHCDFAFSLLSENDSTAGLNVKKTFAEDLILVRSPNADHLPEHVELSDFENLAFVSAPSYSARREIEDRLLLQQGIKRKNTVLALEHAEAIKQAIRFGAGFALLLRSSVHNELNSGWLKEVHVEGLQLSVPVYRLIRSSKRMSKFQTSLFEELTVRLSDASNPL